MNYRTLVTNLESKPDQSIKNSICEKSGDLLYHLSTVQYISEHLDGLKKSVFYKKEHSKKYTDLTPEEEILTKDENVRLLHGIIGLTTEVGELIKAYLDMLDGELDLVNLKEEMGDLRWYQELIYDVISTTDEEVVKKNMEKLQARYGEKFSSEKALNRDLDKERDVLES